MLLFVLTTAAAWADELDLRLALTSLASRMGCRIYVEPAVRGRIARPLGPDDTMQSVVPKGVEWRRIGDLVLVYVATPCWQHVPDERTLHLVDNSQEFVLEHARKDDVLAALRAEFPGTDFTEHPTVEGFFVTGASRGLLRAVKARLLALDRSGLSEPLPQVSVSVHHASAGHVASVLARILPEAEIRVAREVLEVRGPAWVRDLIPELVEVLDEDPPR